MIFSALPILSYLLFYYYFLNIHSLSQGSFRKAFLLSMILWGIAITLGIELLNVRESINLDSLILFWSVVITLQISTIFVIARQKKISNWKIQCKFVKLKPIEYVMAFFIGLTILLIGIAAFKAPPNSWDGLNYHMSRIMFWKQNQSVNHFPTPEFRQLFIQPWQGFAFLHFQILHGGDRFANLIPWFTFIGCIVGVSLIAKNFGHKRIVQFLSALFAATIPSAIMEAPGVRMDVLVAFWIVCLVYFILQFKKTRDFQYCWFVSMAFGLAILTKGTAYLLTFPFMVWYIIILFQEKPWSKASKALIILAGITLLINGGFFWRNFLLSGDPLGPSALRKWGTTHDMDLPMILTNTMRVILFHLGTRIEIWNEALMQFYNNMYAFFKISPVDERGLYHPTYAFAIQVGTHEDNVSNVLQALVIMISSLILIIKSVQQKMWSLIIYIFCIFTGLVLIASVIAFTYHISRYQVTLFLLAAPLVAMVFNPTSKGKSVLTWLLVIVLFAASSEYLYNNNTKKLVSRKKVTVFNTDRFSQYFRYDISWKDPYVKALTHVVSQGCSEVGIVMNFNYWDYPLWVIWENILKQKGRMEHVAYISEHAPKDYPLGNFKPCALIAVDYTNGKFKDTWEFNGHVYVKKLVTDKTIVYY